MHSSTSTKRGRCPSCRHIFVYPIAQPPRTCPSCGGLPRHRRQGHRGPPFTTRDMPNYLPVRSPAEIREMSRIQLASATDEDLRAMSPEQSDAFHERMAQLAKREAWAWAVVGVTILLALFVILPALF